VVLVNRSEIQVPDQLVLQVGYTCTPLLEFPRHPKFGEIILNSTASKDMLPKIQLTVCLLNLVDLNDYSTCGRSMMPHSHKLRHSNKTVQYDYL